MIESERQYNGNLITDLCRIGEAMAKQFPPLGPQVRVSAAGERTCENCGGLGMVPSGSWSDTADRGCDECKGTGLSR